MDESFFEEFIKLLGFTHIQKQNSVDADILKFIGRIDLGVISQQFFIVIFLNKEKITVEDIQFVRKEMGKYVDKGLIISNSKITREAKRNAHKKNEVPIDIIDENGLKKRINEYKTESSGSIFFNNKHCTDYFFFKINRLQQLLSSQ